MRKNGQNGWRHIAQTFGGIFGRANIFSNNRDIFDAIVTPLQAEIFHSYAMTKNSQNGWCDITQIFNALFDSGKCLSNNLQEK